MPRSFGSSQVTFLSADPDLSFGNIEQARNCIEQGRLSAAGRTEQDDELPLLDVEGKAVEHPHRRESDTHIANGNTADMPYPFTAPAAMPRTNQRPETK